jgi:hypothetical protein
LKVEEEELPGTGGPKEVLGMAKDGYRRSVVIFLEPSLTAACEGINEQRTTGASVGVSAGKESAFLKSEAVGFRAHVAQA